MGRTDTNVRGQHGRRGRGGRNATPPPTPVKKVNARVGKAGKAGKASKAGKRSHNEAEIRCFGEILLQQLTQLAIKQADDEPVTPPPLRQARQPPQIVRGQNGGVRVQLQAGEGRVLFLPENRTPGQLGGRARPRKLNFPLEKVERKRRNAVDTRPPPFKLDVMVLDFSLMSVNPHHPDYPADDEMES